MIIKTVEAGELSANCYIVLNKDTKEGFVVDPGGDAEYLNNIINEMGGKIKGILLTHGHFDHVGGVVQLRELTGAPYYICGDEVPYMDGTYVFGRLPKADYLISHNEELTLGDLKIKCIHTPGHSPGGICFLVEGKHLISGDTLFQLGVGRTDFDGGDLAVLTKSIKERLYTLDGDIEVYPGHGGKTTIGFERKYNSFIRE